MNEINFKHFNKLKNRYWKTYHSLDPIELINDLDNKINFIENKDFGPEDEFISTTQAKIVINGLLVKIYYFIKNSIIHTNEKQYISSIALLRLCLEHIVMLSYFENKLSTYLKDNNFNDLLVLLHTFCMGSRIMFVNVKDQSIQKKKFSTRSEHVSEALRYFDKRYGGGVQLIYDMLSDHSHVTPTSSVRMLYRQNKWDQNEPKVSFKRVKLSTISNSHEKLASGGIETILQIKNLIKGDIIDKEEELSKVLEEKGKIMEVNSMLDPNFYNIIENISYQHDILIEEFKEKLKKYIKIK